MRLRIIAGIGVLATAAWAQDVVSARAGLIHYTDGKVYLEDKAVESVSSTKMFSQFPEVKENQTLRTAEGRAEVLLSPGVVLRLGEDSAFRMISNRLTDTRLELVEGEAVIDVADLLKENSVTLRVGESTIQPKRTGVYRVSANPAKLLVYDGQAEVVANDVRKTYKRGSAVTLEPTLMAAKFDTDKGDPLVRWSFRRSSYLAMANLSAAKALLDSGYAWSAGGWRWNPWFGMYTFVPARGGYCSAFGYCFYSPQRIYAVYYQPQPVYGGGGGGGGGIRYGYDSAAGYSVASGRTYGGYSPSASAGPVASAPAASAPASPRGGESSAPRGGDGGSGRQ